MHCGMHHGMSHRPASNARPGAIQASIDVLPPSVGIGNVMLNSCVVGKKCNPVDLSKKLAVAGFNVSVVMLTTAVAASDQVFKFLERAAVVTKMSEREMASTATRFDWIEKHPQEPPHVVELVTQKAVYKANDRVFLVIHRAKVHSCVWTQFTYAAVADRTQLFFGTLDLILDTSRQRFQQL